jgi:hypothetical protein
MVRGFAAGGVGQTARRAWLPVLAVLLIALPLPSCSGKAVCDVCKRAECAAMTFRIEYANGESQQTCCPRCGARALDEAGGREVRRLEAHDFATGRPIDARQAMYVDGSDMEHCSGDRDSPSPDSGRSLHYDRCLPSLVAFATREDAAAFMQEHGGRLRGFDELPFGSARLAP